ncbi:MAG: hypothetical protein ACLP8X_29830 [Streptosporangiaceae bacterium]
MVPSGRYLFLILAAGSGRPYSHRTFTSRMTVSTYPDWEFRDPRLCDEDLSRRPRSEPKAYSRLVSLALAPPPATAPPGGSTG